MTKTRRAHEELTHRIEGLAAHTMLPREVDLAMELQVSRSTLRHVLAGLSRLSMIYTIQGTGTFVADRRVTMGSGVSGFSEDMRARGLVPGSRLISCGPFVATGTVAAELDITPGSLAYRVERLRLADNEPMCLETTELPADLFPGLLTHDLTGSLYDLFKEHYNTEVMSSQQSVSAENPTPEQSELLGINADEPLLAVYRVGFDDRGSVIERASSHYRSDRYHFMLLSRRVSR